MHLLHCKATVSVLFIRWREEITHVMVDSEAHPKAHFLDCDLDCDLVTIRLGPEANASVPDTPDVLALDEAPFNDFLLLETLVFFVG